MTQDAPTRPETAPLEDLAQDATAPVGEAPQDTAPEQDAPPADDGATEQAPRVPEAGAEPQDVEAPEDTAAPEAAPAPEDTPAPEAAPAPEPAPAPEDTTAPEHASAPDAAPVPEDTPATDEVTADETPAPQDTPPADETPAPQNAAPADETPAPQDNPPADAATPRPRPAPVPRPTPRPTPRPGVARTPSAAPAATAPAVAAPPSLSPAEEAQAATFGRVDDDGTVHVREAAGERVVGQFPDAPHDEALAFYVRRYGDLHAKVGLFEARLTATDLSIKEIDTTLEHLAEELAEPAAVGDLDALRARLEALRAIGAERRAQVEAERAEARRAAVEARTAIVEAAEKIAGTEPQRMQWRPAGEQLRTLLDQWKDAQRHGPRIDRTTEDALWKRFSHARSVFDRERRRFFADLEKRNADVKGVKERIVTEAERLAGSRDWGPTSGVFRDLMTQWKAAGRAARKDDDALWARFRAAQDAFFAARDQANKEIDEEYRGNLEVKLALLEEAEALVPVKDLSAAKRALRSVQERWESAGKVPRADVQRVEGRMRAVEQAVRDADQDQWRRSNPETRARAEGAAAQLHAAISSLEADLAAAQESGDSRRIEETQAALDARRAWLQQVERAAAESRG